MDDVKKYDSSSPLFAELPIEVRKVLLHDFEELLSDDFSTIMKYDELNVPNGSTVNQKIRDRSYRQTEDDTHDDFLEALDKEYEQKDLQEFLNEEPLVSRDKSMLDNKEEEGSGSEEELDIEDDDDDNPWQGRLRVRKPKISFK